ncbi:MAG: serine/threonine-protein kinase, partial [Planctomycetia bacterium]
MSSTRPIPEQIGRYRIVRKIGEGGMGAVYHARHLDLERDVALKVLLLQGHDEVLLRRFRNEARAAAMPYHENLVVLYEHGEDDGIHYIAMELVKGTDLRDLIRQKGALPVAFSFSVVRQVTKALDHAHKLGFVHRDIKPSNILVTPERTVKLTDMGLARQLERSDDDGITRDGATVGTVDYIAPEQARNSRDADVRSDLYSLGCTWYHMLAGEVPYMEGGALEKMYKHAHDPLPNLRAKCPQVPEAMAVVLLRLLAKKPADRFQTPRELLVALDQLRGLLGAGASSRNLSEEAAQAIREVAGLRAAGGGDSKSAVRNIDRTAAPSNEKTALEPAAPPSSRSGSAAKLDVPPADPVEAPAVVRSSDSSGSSPGFAHE